MLERLFQLSKRHFPKYLNFLWKDNAAKPITLTFEQAIGYMNPALEHPVTATAVQFKIGDAFAKDGMPQGLIEFDLDVKNKSVFSATELTNQTVVSLTLAITDGVAEADEWNDLYVLAHYRVSAD